MAKCSPWKKVQQPSGRQAWIRVCKRNRANVVHGHNYYTANVYRGGKPCTRLSRKTLSATKAAATRVMNMSAREARKVCWRW